jgi:translocation and assembly module TamB
VMVDIPGQVFVRGRGLDSEWRGRLRITGTTAAPAIDGKLEVVRGTYAFLGKTASLSRGAITFIGGAHIDPEIDIEGRVSSSAVVAIITIAGTATQPSLRLASEPLLPQDEILARVLFGTTTNKISAGQAFEIAQAGAALATGGDPGVLDRIRSRLGLDRLSLGAASANTPYGSVAMPSTPAGVPSAFTASAGSSAAPLGAGSGSSGIGAAAMSAGKYVAEGVYVGVTQGLGAGSSSVDVQVDVTRHISIDTSAGQAAGAGVGVNWKLDY